MNENSRQSRLKAFNQIDARLANMESRLQTLEAAAAAAEEACANAEYWEDERERRRTAAAERHRRDLADLEEKQRLLENDLWAEQQKRQDAERRAARGW